MSPTNPHAPKALEETADDPSVPSFLQSHPHSPSQSHEYHQYDSTESAMESAPNSPPKRAAPAPPPPQRVLSEELAAAETTAAEEAAAAAAAEEEEARAARWSVVLAWLQGTPGMGSAIQTMFTKLDVDSSGSVDIGEFIHGLKSLGR